MNDIFIVGYHLKPVDTSVTASTITMPKISVPVRWEKDKKVKCSAYIAGELRKRVRKTAPLPSNDHKKYKIDTICNYNRSVRRIEGENQFTISQLMTKNGKKFDSDSNFVVYQQ